MTIAGISVQYAYDYDENGLRVGKTYTIPSVGASEHTRYYYNGSVLIGMTIGTDVVMRFSYDASGSVVAVDYSTNNGSSFTTYYYVRNAQNDVVKLIDNSGNSVVEYIYDSWGKVIAATSSLTTGLKDDQPFRYRGYVYDTETQWYYLQSRYYDPTTCRFISADVLLSTGQGVLGHNSFAYCLNNPVNMADDLGMRPIISICDDSRQPEFASKLMLSKNRVERPDSGLKDLPDEDIFRGARDKSLPGKERKRFQKEEKLRKIRNKQKRNSLYSVIPDAPIPNQSYSPLPSPRELNTTVSQLNPIIITIAPTGSGFGWGWSLLGGLGLGGAGFGRSVLSEVPR